MNRIILFIIFASYIIIAYSQKTANISATYIYYAPETMSIEEAKRIALERAKIQAIADEFGTVVSQSTSTMISNKNGESDTQFLSLGGSDVKGEWIETIGNPEYDIKFEDHYLIISCSITGKAREITQSKIDFIAKPLRNGTTLKYESTEFRDGDELYLYFQSPVDGYLSVYLLDEMTQNVYSILPYKVENNAVTPIEGKKEYVFFSIHEADKNDRSKVDEYNLNCVSDKEFNTLYIIFSQSKFDKTLGFGSDLKNMPDYIIYSEFKKWLSKTMMKDNNIQTTQITITICK